MRRHTRFHHTQRPILLYDFLAIFSASHVYVMVRIWNPFARILSPLAHICRRCCQASWRGIKILKTISASNALIYFAKNFFTSALTLSPEACPLVSFITAPITFPNSLMVTGPIFSKTFLIIFSKSSSDISAGR